MPKIIENIREKLIEEAKKQVLEQGYSAMTIRSVATACGVGVGTVYNYFSSKDMLVASFMLEDWLHCQEIITEGCENASCAQDALHCMYIQLKAFEQKYTGLFTDDGAKAGFSSSSKQRHEILRTQLAKPLLNWTAKQDKVDSEFLADFIAESMLNLTMADVEFAKISSVLLQLL